MRLTNALLIATVLVLAAAPVTGVANAAGPGVSVSDTTVIEGNSGTPNASFAVTLSQPPVAPVSVGYATSNATANAGSDYSASSGTVSFAPGDPATKTILVPIQPDTLDEPDETFNLDLSIPSGGAVVVAGHATATIIDDDPPPAVSIDDFSTLEGDPGSHAAKVTVSLDSPSGKSVSVAHLTTDGTATLGSDYLAFDGVLTFDPGETSKTFDIDVLGDSLDESDETVRLSLVNAVNATIAHGAGVGTITDDDATPSRSITDTYVVEGDGGAVTATFGVAPDAISGRTISVDYATDDGTAVAGHDYVGTRGTLVFAPGESYKRISVTVDGDVATELPETFGVTLSGAVNASLARTRGTGTIFDDDDAPPVAKAPAAVPVTLTETPAPTAPAATSTPSVRPIAIAGAPTATSCGAADFTVTVVVFPVTLLDTTVLLDGKKLNVRTTRRFKVRVRRSGLKAGRHKLVLTARYQGNRKVSLPVRFKRC